MRGGAGLVDRLQQRLIDAGVKDLLKIRCVEVTRSEFGGQSREGGTRCPYEFGGKKQWGILVVFLLFDIFFWEHYNKVFQILFLKIKYVFGVNNIFAGKGNTQTRQKSRSYKREVQSSTLLPFVSGPQASPPSKPSFSSDGDYDLSLWPLPLRGLCGMTAEEASCNLTNVMQKLAIIINPPLLSELFFQKFVSSHYHPPFLENV